MGLSFQIIMITDIENYFRKEYDLVDVRLTKEWKKYKIRVEL